VAVNELQKWGGVSTMVMVLHKPGEKTAMSFWTVEDASDQKKTEKILDALADPALLPACTNMGINEIIESIRGDVV